MFGSSVFLLSGGLFFQSSTISATVFWPTPTFSAAM
jgi:hypothetical protein